MQGRLQSGRSTRVVEGKSRPLIPTLEAAGLAEGDVRDCMEADRSKMTTAKLAQVPMQTVALAEYHSP
jgi:hypothetical protein